MSDPLPSALWLVPAFALFLSAIMVRRDIRWRRAEKLEATAEIVGMSENTDSEGSTTYAPRYRFRTIEGREVETSDGFYVAAAPVIGREVQLWYDRARPETVFYNPRGMGVGIYLFLVLFNAVMVGFVWLFTRLAES